MASAQPSRANYRQVDAHPPAAREYPLAINAAGGNGVQWRKPNGGDKPPQATLELTDMHGVTHRLTQDAFEEGVRGARGLYRVLCGKTVLVASMSSQPQSICRECVSALQ